MRLRQLPEGERPRERLLARGAECLSLAELLAVLLRTGDRERDVLSLAGQLLEEFGDLRGLCRASREELLSLKGLKDAKAASLLAALELARRASATAVSPGPSWRDRLRELALALRDEERERIHALFLDRRDRVLSEATVSYGGLDGAFLDLRYLLRRAIRVDAAALVVAHNHPDGSPEPSEEDRRLTAHLRRRLEVLALELRGHFVLADGVLCPVE